MSYTDKSFSMELFQCFHRLEKIDLNDFMSISSIRNIYCSYYNKIYYYDSEETIDDDILNADKFDLYYDPSNNIYLLRNRFSPNIDLYIIFDKEWNIFVSNDTFLIPGLCIFNLLKDHYNYKTFDDCFLTEVYYFDTEIRFGYNNIFSNNYKLIKRDFNPYVINKGSIYKLVKKKTENIEILSDLFYEESYEISNSDEIIVVPKDKLDVDSEYNILNSDSVYLEMKFGGQQKTTSHNNNFITTKPYIHFLAW